MEQIIIDETYRLDNYSLPKIIDKISKTKLGGVELRKDCLELSASIKVSDSHLSTLVRGNVARIINGENIGKSEEDIYLQIYKRPHTRPPLQNGEHITGRDPNYLSLLREFIS